MNSKSVTPVLIFVLFVQALVSLGLQGNVVLAVILVLVATKLRSDRAWLLVPIIVNGVGLLSVLARTLVMPPGQGPPLVRPLLTSGLFLAIYVGGYRFLGERSTYEGPSRGNRGLGWRFDRWAGDR
ncbi:MAG: hypothetical protein M3O88_05790 [Actinomycetota bacterium]|nr:hypothetical protein [Actinomycetota bacterium]